MKKEDLIRRLEQAEVPELHIAGHRKRLKQALMEGYSINQPETAMVYHEIPHSWWGSFLNWLRGPVWRPALASILSVIMLAGMLAGAFYLASPSPSVIAADVVRNDPSIQKKLSGSGEIIIVQVEVRDRVAKVVCGRGIGDFIEADVDIAGRTIVTTRRFEGLFMAELDPKAHENAINIALLDSRVKPILAKGATIGRVFPVFSSISSIAISNDNLIKIVPSGYHAIVPLYVDGKAWLVDVDLEQNRIDRIIEPQTLFMPYYRQINTVINNI